MPAQLIRAGDLYPGAPYAYAAVAPPGSLIFTAGACRRPCGLREASLQGRDQRRQRRPSVGRRQTTALVVPPITARPRGGLQDVCPQGS